MSDEVSRWISLALVFLGTLAGAAVAIHVFVSGVKIVQAQINEKIPALVEKIDELKKRLDEQPNPQVQEVRLTAVEATVKENKTKLEAVPSLVREQVVYALAFERQKPGGKG